MGCLVVWETSVCGESGRYTFAMIGLEQMRELAANAVEASFLLTERKLELTRRVEQYEW